MLLGEKKKKRLSHYMMKVEPKQADNALISPRFKQVFQINGPITF